MDKNNAGGSISHGSDGEDEGGIASALALLNAHSQWVGRCAGNFGKSAR